MSAAIEAAMLEAHQAGLSVIPLRSNKRPAIASWSEYTDAQPDPLLVQMWAKNTEGFAIICGGPTRLQVLDFEGPFIGNGGRSELRGVLDEAGLWETFDDWRMAFLVSTPSGGEHIYVHVMGDGPPPGNAKLAMAADGHTLVETRGQGGYVVGAPSGGDTHPSGEPWRADLGWYKDIPWVTEEEWRGVCAAISQLDAVAASETPPEAPTPTVLPGGVSLSRIEHTNSWIDDVQMPPVEQVLEHMGWTYSHTDAEHNYWTRPDKDPREGHSATVNRAGRLFVFSSNAHPVPASAGRQTYDTIDVLGCYQLGHLPSQHERVGIIRTFAKHSGQKVAADSGVSDDGWLSDDFWESREYLAAIRQAAWETQRCPEGFLGTVLSTFATGIPCSIRLEALVGGATSPLNTYVVLVGRSGAGKSSSLAVARRLVGPPPGNDVHYGVTLRSGEGLISAVRSVPPKTKDNPDPAPLFLRGIQVVFDEGEALTQQSERSGSTVLSTFCSAWSGLPGAKVGGSKAAGDESFAADRTHVDLVMGLQLGVGAGLFTGQPVRQGFTSRLLCFATDRPGDPSLRKRGEPAPLGLPYYYPEQAREIGVMTFPASVEERVSAWMYHAQTVGVGPHDGHQMLLRMRVAALLALMDRNAQVDPVHWELAHEIEKHSHATRNRLLAGLTNVDLEQVRAAGRKDVVRESARRDAWIEDRARRLARRVHNADEPLLRRAQKDVFRGSDERKQLDFIVTYAIERGWVAIEPVEGSKALVPGVKPMLT